VPPQQSLCSSCGQRLADPSQHCSYCGAAPIGVGSSAAQAAPGGAFAPYPALGNPGIGVAGFVLSLLGFSLLGLILSWVGYRQAKREGRPSGLSLAGIIIGAAWLAITVILIVLIVILGAAASSATHMYE
jgi:hypothetical protein